MARNQRRDGGAHSCSSSSDEAGPGGKLNPRWLPGGTTRSSGLARSKDPSFGAAFHRTGCVQPGTAAGKGKKKASSFDEALLAAGARGKQQPPPAAAVVGLPLPRPASLPSPLPSAPASASGSASASSGGGGWSSLGPSAASDEQLDLGVYG